MNTPSILQKIVKHKKKEIEYRKKKHPIKTRQELSTRNFKAAIMGKRLSLIAEVKKASPSEGMISKKGFFPIKIAKKYERYGADAISVLCDKKFFHGDLNHLQNVSKNTSRTPLLCKDFIIDEYQIYEARSYGADAILLIAAILTDQQISKFARIAKSLKMDAICEVHTLEELKRVLRLPVEIIGINNRDLNIFKTDISTTLKLARRIPNNKVIVSESGFSSKEDVAKVRGKANAILVGTALMKSGDISEFTDKKLKVCGIRTLKEAEFCEKLGVDSIGLNFVPTSKRSISQEKAATICKNVQNITKVGIFQDQPLSKVNKIASSLNLDFIQLSGYEPVSFVKKCCRPVIKTISVQSKSDIQKAQKFIPYVAYIILDSSLPGSGKPITVNLKNANYPFLLAGGISPENAKKLIKKINPLGIDVASGVETNGKIDLKKINSIFNQLKK